MLSYPSTMAFHRTLCTLRASPDRGHAHVQFLLSLSCFLVPAVEQGYSYAGSHEWVKVDGDTATIGISDFAQVRVPILSGFKPNVIFIAAERLVEIYCGGSVVLYIQQWPSSGVLVDPGTVSVPNTHTGCYFASYRCQESQQK